MGICISGQVIPVQNLPMADENCVLALGHLCRGTSLRRPAPQHKLRRGPASEEVGEEGSGEREVPWINGGLRRRRRRSVELGGLEERKGLRERGGG
jgi:hypothetical protein